MDPTVFTAAERKKHLEMLANRISMHVIESKDPDVYRWWFEAWETCLNYQLYPQRVFEDLMRRLRVA